MSTVKRFHQNIEVVIISYISEYRDVVLILRVNSVFRDRLPLMFLIGVPIKLNVIQKTFCSDVIRKLSIHLFQSQPSKIFLDTVLEKVSILQLLSECFSRFLY